DAAVTLARRKTPAEISNATDSATWALTRTPGTLTRLGRVAPTGAANFNVVERFVFDNRHAGPRAKTNALRIDARATAAIARPSGETSMKIRIGNTSVNATITRLAAHHAASSAASPPIVESNKPSRSNWGKIRPGPPPTARRTATSRFRD